MVLVVAVLAVSYASSMRAWLQQRSDINTLSAQIAAGKAEVAALREAKQRWHDPAYIRTQARLRFGWVMPGETGYRVIDDDGDILVSGSQLSDPADPPPKSSPEWWETAWSSVVAAGRDIRASVIGYRVGATGAVVINPPKSTTVTLGRLDQVVVIAMNDDRSATRADPSN